MVTAARRILCTSIVSLTTFHAGIALGAWPSGTSINVPLCAAAGDQFNPAIASDGAGGAIVTWEDSRTGANDDIYAQRVNAAGSLQWTANGVALCAADKGQYAPMIASDGAGGAIVTWYDDRSGTNTHIYAQRLNSAGVPQWTADGVALCTADSSQINPTIASDGAGGAIVTWQDLRSGTNSHIYAQHVNAAGVPQWTVDGVALCTAANNQASPRIVSDGAGGAIVAWQDRRNGADDIFAQQVSAAGTPQWTVSGVALCTADYSQINHRIVSDGAGGAIVTWQDHRGGTDDDIYAQQVNAAGVPQWISNGVALCTATGDQSSPSIASDGAGGAIITWQDLRSSFYDIYARRVNAAGVPQWSPNGVALCTAANDEDTPTIASDGLGGAIVTWQDYRGANYHTYAQRMNAAGSPQWTANGVAICTAGYGQYVPTLVPDGAGGAIIAWQDFRNGANADIYAQNINANGTLGGTVLSVPPVSAGASFAIHSIQPNPSLGDLRVSFSLQDGTPAMLELFDLTGRRIESQSVGGLGPGPHVAPLTSRASALHPGIYCVSLTQGSRRAFSKVAILR